MTLTRIAFADTRDSLHQVAEHVLAAAQYAETGTIRLRYRPGGFETTQALPDGRRLAVANGELVVSDACGHRNIALTTLRDIATALGLNLGLPSTAYAPATPLLPDEPLVVDADDARLVGRWYGLADEALRIIARTADSPRQPVIWPEHFDIGITLDAVNYGASQGDDEFPEPYLYVSPHAGPPAGDGFWNASFGAVLGIDCVQSVGDAFEFFQAGRDRLERNS